MARTDSWMLYRTDIFSWSILSGYSLYLFYMSNLIFFRMAKEKVSYEKELEAQQEKVEKMKTENKDEYDIRKQVKTYLFKTVKYNYGLF